MAPTLPPSLRRALEGSGGPKPAPEPAPEPVPAPEPGVQVTQAVTSHPAQNVQNIPKTGGVQVDQASQALEALRQLLAPKVEAAPLDEKRIIELVKQHAPAAEASRSYVFVPAPDAPTTKIDTAHAILPLVTRLVQLKVPVMVWSGAGTSKTTLAHQVSQVLKIPFYSDSYTRGIGRAEILGYRDVAGNAVETQLSQAYEKGGLYLADEGDADGVGIVAMNRALANGQAVLAGRAIHKHEDFRFMLAANTPGTGQANGYRREPLDAAFLDRLMVLEMEPDPILEWRAAGLQGTPPGYKEDSKKYALDREGVLTPEQWGMVVHAFRRQAQAAQIATPLTSSGRAMWLGAHCCRAGIGAYWLVEGLIRKGRPDDVWKTWVNRVNAETCAGRVKIDWY